MMEFISQDIILAFFSGKTFLELVAVVMGLFYLILAMKQSIWCWVAAFIGTVIYVYLFWEVALLMDSLLNVYYVIMAIYGWWTWTSKHSRNKSSSVGLAVSRWTLRQHILALSGVMLLTVVSGLYLQNNTGAAWPFLDSLTTWASVLTTWMVARKVLENWLYWIVIDGLSIVIYVERGLYPTAGLFAVYTVMCVFGFIAWKNALDQSRAGEKSWHAEPVV